MSNENGRCLAGAVLQDPVVAGKKIMGLVKKLKDLTFLGIIKRIPQKDLQEFVLSRLYYYLNFVPENIVLDLTSRCNAACPFCARTGIGKKGGVDMSRDIFYKAVDEAASIGIKSSRIYSTGEPLLHPDIDEFIAYLKEKGFYVTVSTNAQFMENHFDSLSLADCVKYSIEGWDKDSYEYYRKNCNFEKVQKNISEFRDFISTKEKKPCTVIGLMVNKETNVEQFFKVWGDKVDDISLGFSHHVIKWQDEKIEYVDLKEERLRNNMYTFEVNDKFKYCGYPFSDIVVSPKGNVVICCEDFDDYVVFGNVKEKSLLEIIHSPKRKQVQEQFICQEYNICMNCSSFYKLDSDSRADFNKKLALHS